MKVSRVQTVKIHLDNKIYPHSLWAAEEDPGLQSELGAEYTRPYGDCNEHAARFGHPQVTGEGPGLSQKPVLS